MKRTKRTAARAVGLALAAILVAARAPALETVDAPTATAAAASPTIKPAAGTYGSSQYVTLADKTHGAAIYYTTDGTTPTTKSTKYTKYFEVSKTSTVQAIAVANGYANSAVTSATYTILPFASHPTFSPAAGTYSTPQTVTIADATRGAVIYYTTDGSIPTTSSPKYTAPIKVTGTTTITAIAAATGYADSKVRSAAYVINTGVGPITGGNVFSNGALDKGVGFFPFGGSLNNPLPAVDPTTPFTDGSASLKVVVTGVSGNYSGGAWVASAPRNLTAANALVFWAKANQTQSTLKVQLGNDAGSLANVNYQVESIGIPLTTTWTQYVIPLPDPTKANGLDGLFSFADANNNYTFWLADVEYAVVPKTTLGAPTQANAGWPAITIPVGAAGAFTLNPAPNSIIWENTVPPLPNGGNLDNVAWRWFTLTSSEPSIATVSEDGVVTGVAPGAATITATVGGLQVAGGTSVTVTAPLATPTTNAATPTLPAADVTALFDSSGVYKIHAVDSFDQPNFCSAILTDPYLIPNGKGVLKYQLNACVGVTFGDGEAGNTTNTVNASAYTTFHMDVWSPNPDDLQLQLVNNADPGPADVGIYDAGIIASGQWVSLDIPFASFTGANGLKAENALQQMLLVSANPGMIVYVDNIYFH